MIVFSSFQTREAAEKLDLDLRTSEPGEARAAFRSFQLSFDDQVVVVVYCNTS